MLPPLSPNLQEGFIMKIVKLTAENFKKLKDKDYQIWIEMVDESGKVGIYIEDGELK